MSTTNPHQYIKDADLLFSEHEVSLAISSLAATLNSDFKNDLPILLSVMTGATVFSGQLLPKLTFPLKLDYVHATRYQGGVEGRDISWVVKPSLGIKDKNILVLDDILDEGFTLKAIVDACYDLGAKQVKVAVMVEKELNKNKPIKADYFCLKVPNRYVFGCGMDVYGWWRNLPAIYALKNT